MTKIEITDEMVERFLKAGGTYQSGKSAQQCIREGLEAALNPPAEQEIPVTQEMLNAGHGAYNGDHPNVWARISSIYRSMRRLEPPTPRGQTFKNTWGDGALSLSLDG